MRWWPWQRRKRQRLEFRSFATAPLFAEGPSVADRPEGAMALSTVYACVDRLASTISTLPVHLYEDSGTAKMRVKGHPLQRLFKVGPNDFQTWSDFVAYLMRCLLLRGNFFARIYRSPRTGDIVRLLPIAPDRVKTKLHPNRHRLEYFVDTSKDPLPEDAVWHVRGLPDDDFLVGLSAIQAAAKVIDAGLSAVTMQKAVNENMANPRDIFESDDTLDPEEAQEFLDDWKAKTSGVKAGGAYVLPSGLKHKQLTISAEDRQFLESRRLTAAEIAGIFGLPLFMVHGDATTWTEEVQTYVAMIAIRPWLVRIEQSFARDCLLPDEQDRYYIRFSMEGLLRASLAARTQAHKTQLETGMLSINEARALEDRPPRPGGDMFFAPLNLAHLDGQTGRIIYNGPQNPIDTAEEQHGDA